jgi:hypothetical protein
MLPDGESSRVLLDELVVLGAALHLWENGSSYDGMNQTNTWMAFGPREFGRVLRAYLEGRCTGALILWQLPPLLMLSGVFQPELARRECVRRLALPYALALCLAIAWDEVIVAAKRVTYFEWAAYPRIIPLKLIHFAGVGLRAAVETKDCPLNMAALDTMTEEHWFWTTKHVASDASPKGFLDGVRRCYLRKSFMRELGVELPISGKAEVRRLSGQRRIDSNRHMDRQSGKASALR